MDPRLGCGVTADIIIGADLGTCPVKFRRFVVVLALASLCPPVAVTAAAQVIVQGQVRDSLTGQPFANARVQLVPQATPWSGGETALSDSLGRFQFDRVAPGTYSFGFSHVRLDSLGVDGIVRTLSVRTESRPLVADLALPSAASLLRSFCGVRTDTTGVVIGTVRDAATGLGRAQVPVRAQWGEIVLQGGQMRTVMSQVAAMSAMDGRFVLCGVPSDVPVLMQAGVTDSLLGAATHRDVASGEFEIVLSTGVPFKHRDVWVSSQLAAFALTPSAGDSTPAAATLTARARLVGQVFRPDGTALSGARVRLASSGASGRYAVSDAAGAFTLDDLPAGTHAVEAIAIGFTPTRVVVDLRPGPPARATVAMQARVTTLEAVTVRGLSRYALGYASRRQKGGMGFFMTGDEARARGQPLVSMALLGAPGVRVGDMQFGRPVLQGSFRCQPRFFLDGWEIENEELDRFVSVNDLGGVEVYRQWSEAPPQLMRSMLVTQGTRTQCQLVLIWSKSVVP